MELKGKRERRGLIGSWILIWKENPIPHPLVD